jgi:ATP-dependent DNA helicase RecG
MTDQELESLLDDIESDRMERKASVADSDKIRQAICAFANDLPNHRQPGILFVGVDDKGKPVGLRITDQLLQTLSAMRSDGNILPFPSMLVQKRTLKGADIAVVIVQPSDAPPVRYKGRMWIRIGPRRGIATLQEERQLAEKRRFHDLPFDIHPVPSLSLDVLDELLFWQVYLPSAVDVDVLIRNERTLEISV